MELKTYLILMLGLELKIGSLISSTLNYISLTAMVVAVLEFTCTIAILLNAKPVNGILGLLSTIIYIVISINAQNYANVV